MDIVTARWESEGWTWLRISRRRCRIKSNTSVNKNTSKHKYMCIQKETNKTWVINLKLKRIHFSNTRKHAHIQTQPRMQTHNGINTRANTHIRKTQTHKIRTNTQISILDVEIYKKKKSKILKLVFFLVDSVVVILFSYFFSWRVFFLISWILLLFSWSLACFLFFSL